MGSVSWNGNKCCSVVVFCLYYIHFTQIICKILQCYFKVPIILFKKKQIYNVLFILLGGLCEFDRKNVVHRLYFVSISH